MSQDDCFLENLWMVRNVHSIANQVKMAVTVVDLDFLLVNVQGKHQFNFPDVFFGSIDVLMTKECIVIIVFNFRIS